MKKTWHWIKNEHPTWVGYGVGGLVTLFVGFSGWNVSEEQKAALITVVLLLLGVANHAVVTPVEKAKQAELDAAVQGASIAANKVASDLTSATAGVAGTITTVGGSVVNVAIDKVRGTIGGLLGR